MALGLCALHAGCGSRATGIPGEVGTYDPDAGMFTGAGDASDPGALDAHIERSGIAITFVTLTCADGCADVKAVVTGGRPPYSFRWEDGSTSDARHVCPTASTAYAVTVTDTGSSGEFAQAPQTTQAALTARVLACPDAGPLADDGGLTDGGAPAVCLTNPSFEGTPQVDVPIVAAPWQTCDNLPDVLDGKAGGIALQPSDGKSYLDLQYYPDSTSSPSESVGEPLCAPMRAGTTVHVAIDVAAQDTSLFSVQFFGAATLCGDDQLLGETPAVAETTTWTPRCATLHAQTDVAFLKVRLGNGQSTLGIMGFIDNLRPVASCP